MPCPMPFNKLSTLFLVGDRVSGPGGKWVIKVGW